MGNLGKIQIPLIGPCQTADVLCWVVACVSVFVFLHFFRSVRQFSKRKFRFVVYETFIGFVFNNPLVNSVLSGVAAAYFVLLDVMQDRYKIITDHIEFHERAFAVVLCLTIASVFMKAIVEWIDDESDKHYTKFLERLSILASSVVKNKLDRFKKEAVRMSPSGNTFRQITHPNDQINILLKETTALLRNVFGVKKKELSISIMHRNPHTLKWRHAYKVETKVLTDAQTLMEDDSAAARCIEEMDSIFSPSKHKASKSKKEKYFLSSRDKKSGDGSIYCYPSVTKNVDYTDQFVISISTYGKFLCDVHDKKKCEWILDIFDNICQRIDLELTLDSMKRWQESCQKNGRKKNESVSTERDA